jgi:hypothetical protein
MILRSRAFAVCVLLSALSSGCVTRVIEVRPVAPVSELRPVPVYGRAVPAMSTAQDRHPLADEPVGNAGVEVEAVVPGMSTGRSLSIETESRAR